MSAPAVIDLAEARAAEERRKATNILEGVLAKSDKGAVLATVSNIILILSHDSELKGLCGYNEFLATAVIHRAPPVPVDGLPPLAGPFPRPWQTADVSHVQAYIQRVWTKGAKRQDIDDSMSAVAGMHRFHPVRDWLNGLMWDGTDRLGTWLARAFGAEETEYHSEVGTCFLVAAVRRVRQPGCKFDHMLILEGMQEMGKSSACRTLFGDDWFTDALPAALESRDAALGLQGVWGIEFAEIEQLIRTEVEVIKAFITRSVDRFRAPYGRTFLSYPRQSVLIGTTNDDDYLRDPTGNRRFWPVSCRHADAAWIKSVRDQLWAEAAAREADGESHYLVGQAVRAAATKQQQDRAYEDVWEERIMEALALRSEVTTAQVLSDVLNIPVERQTKREQMRVATVLRRRGWIRLLARRDGVVTRFWGRKVVSAE